MRHVARIVAVRGSQLLPPILAPTSYLCLLLVSSSPPSTVEASPFLMWQVRGSQLRTPLILKSNNIIP